jgi:transcriptional regulator with XRE-family HTH domain
MNYKDEVYAMKQMLELLRNYREDNDLKQADVAELIGTTQQQYSKYETGESELPLRALAVLADRYGLSADYLMGRTECKEGVTGQNIKVCADYTAGALISDILSLSEAGRAGVVEYVSMRKMKERYERQDKPPRRR